jgi:tubulin polyglutamylase TTLL1
MIDSKFHPWLIEINTNPCLELSSPVLMDVIPQMVENALKIALDSILPPPQIF